MINMPKGKGVFNKRGAGSIDCENKGKTQKRRAS